MNTHQHTPHQRSRYNMGYRTCPNCDFQFTPESDDQTTCKLCQTASVFRARRLLARPRVITCARPQCSNRFTARSASHKYCDDCQKIHQQERKAKGPIQPRTCTICDRPFWPRSNAAKICHKDECKREGMRRAEQRYLEKKKTKGAA